MASRSTRWRTWLWTVPILILIALSGFAMKQSTSIRASWRVLPYQSIRLSDSSDAISTLSFEIPEATALDLARGYIESEHAVRLHIVSNTSWTLQVYAPNLPPEMASRMQLRGHGDEYRVLSNQPQVVAQGKNGVFEVSIDYRLLAGPDGAFSFDPMMEIICMLMPD